MSSKRPYRRKEGQWELQIMCLHRRQQKIKLDYKYLKCPATIIQRMLKIEDKQ